MAKFVERDASQLYLLPVDIREWVPEDDLAHFVLEAVERVAMSALQVNERGTGSAQYCTGLVFPRHSGSPVSDQAASFTTSGFSFGTMGGSLFRPSASRKACAGVRPLRR